MMKTRLRQTYQHTVLTIYMWHKSNTTAAYEKPPSTTKIAAYQFLLSSVHSLPSGKTKEQIIPHFTQITENSVSKNFELHNYW